MSEVPTTIAFPEPLPALADGDAWQLSTDGVDVRLTNLDKLFWAPEGYTKADLVAYYWNCADRILPYLRDRPLTLKRMPEGADAAFFYAKQAPGHTPGWVTRVPVTSRDTGKRIDYLLAQDRASLLWLANLGCIELHPWHSRLDRLDRPDYAFFDLDPFDVDFATVREVALLIRTVLDRLGLRGYPRTSGATGMQVYVPVERVHSYAEVRAWVGRVCRLVNRADPERTTMEWSIPSRSGRVFLDHNMNTEGKNIAATYSLRPERGAPVATPLRWAEVEAGVEPGDFTIVSVWSRVAAAEDLGAPLLAGGQDLRAAMDAVGMRPHEPGGDQGGHEAGRVLGGRRAGRASTAAPPSGAERAGSLERYAARRDFARTNEPPAGRLPGRPAAAGRRFVIQHHLATRLHHDLRLERGGVAPSWALPKGLPDVTGLRHLAVRTEDHPLAYLDFAGDIPAGQYGAGPVRIWDAGTYEALEWAEDKVTVRLHGRRHTGTWHLFRTGGRDGVHDDSWLVVRTGQDSPPPAPPPPLLPMLAGGAAEPFDDDGWLFEVKWDGVRALATTVRPGAGPPGSTRLTARHGNDVTAAYPELQPLWERVLARNAVLDGELVALDRDGVPSFQRLQKRMHLRDAPAVARAREHTPVTYMAFDLLFVDGHSLTARPLSERLERLEGVLIPGGHVRRSETVDHDGKALFAAVRDRGLEGLIAKRVDSLYQPGRRSRDWLKVKVRRRVDCVVGGWVPGEGGRGASFGSLLLGLYDAGRLRFVGRVGSGFDDEELRHVLALLLEHASDTSPFADGVEGLRAGEARWTRPRLVCAVEYGEATAGGRLRAPVYKGLREHVDPRSCLAEELAGAGP